MNPGVKKARKGAEKVPDAPRQLGKAGMYWYDVEIKCGAIFRNAYLHRGFGGYYRFSFQYRHGHDRV